MSERTGIYKFRGQDAPIVGPDIEIGQAAPEFHAHTLEWEWIPVLASTQGKVRIIAALPSLETSVCDRETRRFNQEAAGLSKDIAVVVISADLPYTQKRWCGAAGIDQVMVVSDHREVEFGVKYGCLMKDQRILRRAVFVIDRRGIVTYRDYMPAMGDEPNYDAVLAAAQKALEG